ncbi:MAG: methylaspartate mutase accessory protein GlmL, partial [Candidatus Adiutrix sp.]
MSIILAADIGSTFTKLTAIDLAEKQIIASAKAFTTIETDVMEGFQEALDKLQSDKLQAKGGPINFDKKLAASSAAGGLKMVAVGLVPDLTVQAARLAAANAGAKILKTFAFELNEHEMDQIITLKPDMVLLSGGIDGGNKEVIIHNARLLAASLLSCPVVVAGNKSALDEIKKAFEVYKGEVFICENVMPEINKLNIGPAQAAIRKLFIKHIIKAKGLDKLQKTLSAEIIPTPLSVFEAARLLASGPNETGGLGEIMVFDVGGATTDVYSMAEGLPTCPNVFLHGLKQPFAKRTVEGDLGLRYSQKSLVDAIGLKALAENLGRTESDINDWLSQCALSPGLVVSSHHNYKQIDDALAHGAVKIAMGRHCGFLEQIFTASGPAHAQTGKDLSQVAYVIGTGGPIIKASAPKHILEAAVYKSEDMAL